jgi:hypothetical protein
MVDWIFGVVRERETRALDDVNKNRVMIKNLKSLFRSILVFENN